MQELIVAFGLVLVIEGALYALFPDQVRRMMAIALSSDVGTLRIGGLAAAVIGFIIVWMVRG